MDRITDSRQLDNRHGQYSRAALWIGTAVLICAISGVIALRSHQTDLEEELFAAEKDLVAYLAGHPRAHRRLHAHLARARRLSIWDHRPSWLAAVVSALDRTPPNCRPGLLNAEKAAACWLRRHCFAKAAHLYRCRLARPAARYVDGLIMRLAKQSRFSCRDVDRTVAHSDKRAILRAPPFRMGVLAWKRGKGR